MIIPLAFIKIRTCIDVSITTLLNTKKFWLIFDIIEQSGKLKEGKEYGEQIWKNIK